MDYTQQQQDMINNIADIDVLELLPQRPPFVMIDRLLHYDPVVTEAVLEIRPNNIFCREGHFSDPGLMENIAQTCAARIGFQSLLNNEPIRLGFIGEMKKVRVEQLPRVGETLHTRIEVVGEVLAMTLVKATVTSADRKVVECQMKIALSEQVADDNQAS